ncbi:hypothetical protein BTW08_17410, partial [Salinicola sp. MH3R3-1]
ATSYEIRATSYELRATSYERKSGRAEERKREREKERKRREAGRMILRAWLRRRGTAMNAWQRWPDGRHDSGRESYRDSGRGPDESRVGNFERFSWSEM